MEKQVVGSLGEVVAALRDELMLAQRSNSGESGVQFVAEQVDVELTVVARRTADANATLKFWVVEGGAAAKLEKEHQQRVSLRLVPVTTAGEKVKISDHVEGRPW